VTFEFYINSFGYFYKIIVPISHFSEKKEYYLHQNILNVFLAGTDSPLYDLRYNPKFASHEAQEREGNKFHLLIMYLLT
jgi:hypothetical protein